MSGIFNISSLVFGQQRGDYSRPRDAIKSVSQIENNSCRASKTGPVELIHKSLVMSPLSPLLYEADTYMGLSHLNPSVRSRYFNYQLRPANLHFILDCFNSFCAPSTLYNPPLSGRQECRKLPEIINGQLGTGVGWLDGGRCSVVLI